MYGLPEDFDGSFLIGRALEMICFNANQIYLHFDGQVTITIEGSFSHQRAQYESNTQILSVPVSESDLMQLLEHKISAVSGDKDGTLKLVFDHDQILRCYDQLPNYESYQIRHGDTVIIV
jgi:Family of unknown function (DUF6188)